VSKVTRAEVYHTNTLIATRLAANTDILMGISEITGLINAAMPTDNSKSPPTIPVTVLIREE
jgi:hypothetical protein